MSAEKLAFLQNFYTDVTLYIPAEPGNASAEPTHAAAAPAPVPAPVAPAPPKPARDIVLPPTGFSRPSAGLDRLVSSFNHAAGVPAQPAGTFHQPAAGPEPSAAAPERSAAPPEHPAAPSERSAGDYEHSAQGLSGRSDGSADRAAAPAVSPVMLTQFTTLGSKAQGVILLFRLPNDQFQKLHRNVFLNKMLQALNLIMEDVVLVNVESDLPVALVSLRRELAATHIVAFGKNLLDVTLRNTQIYEPVQFPSLGLAYLASATVDLVEYDVSLKKRLWPGLQAMFLG